MSTSGTLAILRLEESIQAQYQHAMFELSSMYHEPYNSLERATIWYLSAPDRHLLLFVQLNRTKGAHLGFEVPSDAVWDQLVQSPLSSAMLNIPIQYWYDTKQPRCTGCAGGGQRLKDFLIATSLGYTEEKAWTFFIIIIKKKKMCVTNVAKNSQTMKI